MAFTRAVSITCWSASGWPRRLKIAAGGAYPLDEEINVVLRGRDLADWLAQASVSSVEIREGIAGPVQY